MALSTSSMLLLDQRTLQIKYRIPATEIYRLSLSPFHDNIAVFHVKAVSDCSGENFIMCHVFLKTITVSLLVGSRTQKRWFCVSNCTRHRSDYETIPGCSECDWSTAGSLHRFRVRPFFACDIFLFSYPTDAISPSSDSKWHSQIKRLFCHSTARARQITFCRRRK